RDTDGAGRDLDETLAWQAWLWRLVREEVAAPHLAEQLDVVVERLRSDPGVVDLPTRIALFGATRVPESLRTVLTALAVHREVSLFLPHPSDALWSKIAAQPLPVPRPRSAATRLRPDHPLLAALARDVQELQEVLSPVIDQDFYHPVPGRGTTLLAVVQEGLAGDELRPDSSLRLDDSLEVHACHGPERQVEVLRDRLLRLFDDHPDLQPRDVLVMCPDVETYAPLIQGAFGQAGLDHPGFSLRVRLADRGLRETNEVLDVLAAVVELAAGRVRSGELIDLLGLPGVQRRFGFTPDELDTVSGWVQRSGIRWAIDDVQRDRFGMGGFPQGTAAVGRDRLLLGVLAEESENQWLGPGLPMAGVESTKIDLVGRFAELLARLGLLLREMDGRRSAHTWAELLIGAVDALTDAHPDTQWQRAQAIEMITDALDTARSRDIELGRDDIRGLLRRLVAARPTRSNFCTGELTVCTLTPMRSVPHRAVILLGIDSGVFPRAGSIDGDDILRRVPLIGERDRGDEDRQVFLDAIGSAIDHLLIFYTGADPVTGAIVPPPVVLSELIDTAGEVAGRTGVVQRHTLHAFDTRNFQIADGAPPLSYDTRLLQGARA
ncbi:MAG: exodeoxyribonuclease V subunit gamma, partial [Gordonia sp. (in: high G+C Gram-positive bacteria)]|uniref:exodeoxyribonuclease V subunit gamma n=1 Tax=Gordonia sp. (in: high G+C Gram-positive bacteria) TaxID=84139 RepID=UPI003BB7C3BB